jgi:predicted TIM-barrel fold metal-dependent hydrolase
MDSATMEFPYIIDSHSHWGPSLTLAVDITTRELLRQQEESGITHVALIPFPSTAIDSNEINVRLLTETKQLPNFIPYHYIREDYDRAGFDPIPKDYYGGKWHWMRGWQDSASNYRVLEDTDLPALIEKLRRTGKPVIFEEELAFTERFVEMAPNLPLIVPHLGILGGNPLSFLRSFKDNESIYFDTALSSRDTLLQFVRTVGPERVLFGSDVPFGSMENELSKVLSLPISRGEMEFLLYRNFMRLTNYRPSSLQ